MKLEMTKEKFLSLYNAITQEDIDQNYKGLSYISWANAYKMLIEEDPDAEYEIEENENGFIFEQFGICFVKTKVTAFGKTKKMWLPIMNNNHIAVKMEAMTGNHVNTSIMRCLAKNIAMFGIGLKLYVGEDIPKDEEDEVKPVVKGKTSAPKPKTEKQKLEDACAGAVAKGKKDELIAVLGGKKVKDMTVDEIKDMLPKVEKL